MEGHVIIYVEGDQDYAQLVKKVIKVHVPGFKVIDFPTAESALSQIYLCKPVLVLTNLALPGMDGIQLIRHLRAHEVTRHIPYIVIAGAAQPEDFARAIKEGAYACFDKPFQVDKFISTIKAATAAGS